MFKVSYLNKIYFALFLIGSNLLYSQEDEKHTSLDTDYYYGTILEHSPKIGHLITGHPEGFLLRYNYHSSGKEAWQRRHNYPDWGFSFAYQDMKNPSLGEMYGVFSHINWYFFKRNLQLSVGQGVGYMTNPYDKENNFRNSAYGSHLLSATFLKLNFHKPNIWNRIGVQAGISLFHFSNGAVKLPNTSTNTLAFNFGVNYQMDDRREIDYMNNDDDEKITEPIKFNLALRFGINESSVVGLGQYPFVIIVAYADKRLSRSSRIVFGSELFLSYFLKELIDYQVAAFPERDNTDDYDFKRAGVFIGYELQINKLAPFVNLGYYYYNPFGFGDAIYNRIGLKRYFGKKEEIYGLMSVKSHAAKAEALEFGIGYRF